MFRIVAAALRILAGLLFMVAVALVAANVIARRPSEPPLVRGRWRELSPPDFR